MACRCSVMAYVYAHCGGESLGGGAPTHPAHGWPRVQLPHSPALLPPTLSDYRTQGPMNKNSKEARCLSKTDPGGQHDSSNTA